MIRNIISFLENIFKKEKPKDIRIQKKLMELKKKKNQVIRKYD